jgi:hypothetical protein
MITVSHSGNTVEIDGKSIALDYPVKEAFVVGGLVVVLFDPDANLGKQGQFRNLVALRQTGELAWIAEFPTSKASDVYYRVSSRQPLKVASFSSYECEIAPQTGRILSKTFFK